MDKATIRFVIEHIQEQFMEILTADEHKKRLLDGHKKFVVERNGWNVHRPHEVKYSILLQKKITQVSPIV